MENKIYKYCDNPITFQNGDNVMVNATQMAKSFDKNPTHFLRNKQTLRFMTELQNRNSSDILTVTYGDQGGTWMHEKLALKFAAWLSPEFELWIYDRIKELMQHGMTATSETLENMIDNPDLIIQLATKLKEERAQLKVANEKIELDAPKVNYVKKFFDADGTMSVGEMAKTFGIKPNMMFRMMRDDGYLIIRKGTDWNNPKQQYINAGYLDLKITVKNEIEYTQTRITPRGHGYFAKKYNLFFQ